MLDPDTDAMLDSAPERIAPSKNFLPVCAGSAMQCSKAQRVASERDVRFGIHDVKQRPSSRCALRRAGTDHTTIGAACRRCRIV